MSARGMLANPALFAGFNEVPLSCLSSWVRQNFINLNYAMIIDKAENN